MNEPSTIDTLHVASFTGNVGDNANHNGTRRTLQENTNFEFRYTENEMRKYYQNYNKLDSLSFGDDFVAQANKHDLVLIGSGNFFDLWIETSETGTTIDMQPKTVDAIDTPIVFYGLGCDPHKGIPGDNAKKFVSFLDHILSDEHCIVSVRNDGSISHINRLFGQEYARQVHKVPDGGFFTEVDNHFHPELRPGKTIIALNVAKDMAELRFPADSPDSHSYTSFMDEMAEFIDRTLSNHSNIEFVLMPHIYSDLEAIADLMDRLDNLHRRGRVMTTPYLNQENSERYIFDTYRKADLAMGMRFHTNVCSFGQLTPTIGFSMGYPKVRDLYEIELGLPKRLVDVCHTGFSSQLYESTMNSIERSNEISTTYEEKLSNLRDNLDEFHKVIDSKIEETYS